MAKYTVAQIAAAAQRACFYVTPDGEWLHMQYTDVYAGTFTASDEESDEDYVFAFDEMVDEDIHFKEITRIVI